METPTHMATELAPKAPSDPPSRTSGVVERSASGKPWLDEPTLELRARIAGAPSDGSVKGWLIHSVVENAKRAGVELDTPRRYVGFKDYPVAEYLDLLGQAAVRVDPRRPPLQTLRALGRNVFEAFSTSLFGKVIVAGLPSGHAGARTGLQWISRVYKMTSNHARVSFVEPSDDVAIVTLDDVWSFPDAYHVGIFEGAATGFGGNVTVKVVRRSLCSAVLTFQWND